MAPKKDPSVVTLKGEQAEKAVRSSSLPSSPPLPAHHLLRLSCSPLPSPQVLDYLITQNRPYGSTDISANLHNAVSKPAATKVLADLSKRDVIASKTWGNQTIYAPKQSEDDGWSPEEIKEAEEEIKEKKREEQFLAEQLKPLNASESRPGWVGRGQWRGLT